MEQQQKKLHKIIETIAPEYGRIWNNNNKKSYMAFSGVYSTIARLNPSEITKQENSLFIFLSNKGLPYKELVP